MCLFYTGIIVSLYLFFTGILVCLNIIVICCRSDCLVDVNVVLSTIFKGGGYDKLNNKSIGTTRKLKSKLALTQIDQYHSRDTTDLHRDKPCNLSN